MAGAEHRQDRGGVFVRGEGEHVRKRRSPDDLAGGPDAPAAGHPHVDDRDVRLLPRRELDRRACVVGRGDDLQIRLGGHDGRESLETVSSSSAMRMLIRSIPVLPPRWVPGSYEPVL